MSMDDGVSVYLVDKFPRVPSKELLALAGNELGLWQRVVIDSTGMHPLGTYKGCIRNVKVDWTGKKSFSSFNVVLNPFVVGNVFCVANGDNDATYVWFKGKCYSISDCVGEIESICFLKDWSGVMIVVQSDIGDYALFQVGPKGKVRYVCFYDDYKVFDISDSDILDIQRCSLSGVLRKFV